MASGDDFTIIEKERARGGGPPQLFPDFKEFTSNKVAMLDVQITTALRETYPELTITTVPSQNVNFLQFAAAGFAQGTHLVLRVVAKCLVIQMLIASS
jgi:hypothetical protein